MSRDAILRNVDDGLDASLGRLFELLRIPSISTDPAYKGDCRRAAEWLVESLRGIGFDVALRETPGHPMVVAHHKGDGPRLLFYGHYDVQPVDPLSLWHRDPFDPAIVETPAGPVIHGRGTADDKGQLMTFVEAFRAWKDVTGSLPGDITIFLEGEEESGSPSLIPFLEAHKDELKADFAMVCDTGMFDAKTPAICTMLRGMVAQEVTVHGPSRDLHSGLYGGAAINPIRVLCDLMDGLWDDRTGAVTLPGFYDGVDPIPNAIKAGWDSLDFDADEFLGAVGLKTAAGEKGYTALEQTWARPTCEINGIWGGYTGDGFKTVLPAKASTKISFRLVGRQDPKAVQASLKDYLEANIHPDCRLEFKALHGAGATVMPTDDPLFGKAKAALSDEWENDAVFVGGGGSIPVVGHFRDILGTDSVLIGFGLDDDNLHSPNEKYNLSSFHKGIRSWVRILDAIYSA